MATARAVYYITSRWIYHNFYHYFISSDDNLKLLSTSCQWSLELRRSISTHIKPVATVFTMINDSEQPLVVQLKRTTSIYVVYNTNRNALRVHVMCYHQWRITIFWPSNKIYFCISHRFFFFFLRMKFN